jgi:hypothetical protein
MAAVVWGTVEVAPKGVGLGAAPFVGTWHWHAGVALLVASALGVTVVIHGGRVARSLGFVAMTAVAAATTIAWTLALAASDGWARVTAPLASATEPEPFATHIRHVGGFLRGFVRLIDTRPLPPVHVRGHPPGAVVVANVLDRIGIGGAGWLAALAITAWGVAVACALFAMREVAGEPAARRVAPLLAVLPASVWAGTSLDALYAGVGALAVALTVLACGRRSPVLAVAAGIALAAALMATYGTVALVVIPAVVAVRTRRLRPFVIAVATAIGALVALRAATGFDWLTALHATRAAYWRGVASRRPALYLALLGNVAALAVAAGPAAAGGIAAVRARWPSSVLPAAAVLAVATADASQLSRGEVERIWLPFVPWLALGARHERRWLAAQVGVAIAIQAMLRSPW